jgi:hypothetical protein
MMEDHPPFEEENRPTLHRCVASATKEIGVRYDDTLDSGFLIQLSLKKVIKMFAKSSQKICMYCKA